MFVNVVSRMALMLSGLSVLTVCSPVQDQTNDEAAGPAVWRLTETPLASIGVVDGDEHYQFVRVSSAWRHADGRIGVLEAGRPALLFYDSMGNFLMQAGKRGQGPGEFLSRAFGWLYRGDSIAVHDLEQDRLSVFDARGTYARSFRSPMRQTRRPGMMRSGSCCSIRASFADGSFAGRPPDDIPIGPGAPRHSTVSLMRISADGSRVDTLGTFESSLFKYDPSAPSHVRHYETSFDFRFAVAGDQLVGGNGLLDGLLAIRPGAAVDTLPLPSAARPFTAELRTEYEQALRTDYEKRGKTVYEGSLESNLPHDYPAVAPRFVEIRADADHHIWLQRWDPRYGRLECSPGIRCGCG